MFLILDDKIKVIYVSLGQKLGPRQVAINLITNFYANKKNSKIQIISIVDNYNIKIKEFNDVINVVNILNGYSQLFYVTLFSRPDIVHFNFPPLHPLLYPTLLLLKLLNIKIIYSFHGGILMDVGHSMLLKKVFLWQCNNLYDVIIANSNFSKNILKMCLNNGNKKIYVIFNGIMNSRFKNRKQKKLIGSPVILFVGRIEYVKGVDVLIRAFAEIQMIFPDSRLHLVGRGKDKKYMVNLAEDLSIRNKIHFHGYVPHNKISNFYAGADMLVVPSRIEGFGIVVLEGMASGNPIVVSNRGALPELIVPYENGLVCSLTPKSIANACIQIHKDKSLYKIMQKNNLEKAKKFDWEIIGSEYLKLYDKLKSKT